MTVTCVNLTITDCVSGYMVNGIISRDHALQAVIDHMSGLITKACICDILALYATQSGDQSVIIPGCNCLQSYRVNGIVSRANALKSVNDYLNGIITKACACDVVNLYVSQSGDTSIAIQDC